MASSGIYEILMIGDAEMAKRKREEYSKSVTKVVGSVLHPIRSIERNTIGRYIALQQTYNVVKSTVKQSVNFCLSRYFNLKEDYMAESNYNRFKTTVSKVTGFGTAIASGAVTGSVAGPIGTAIGAVAGAASATISNVISDANAKSSVYLEINTSRQAMTYSRVRAGLENNSKGTEN